MSYSNHTLPVNHPHAHGYSDPRRAPSSPGSHVPAGHGAHHATLSHMEPELARNYLASRHRPDDGAPPCGPHHVQRAASTASPVLHQDVHGSPYDVSVAGATFVSQARNPTFHQSSYSSLAGALGPSPTFQRTSVPSDPSSGTVPHRGYPASRASDSHYSPHAPYSRDTSSSASSPPTSSSAPHFRSTPRRNKPASSESALSPLSWPDNTWQCPYCPYIQLNKRGPDFRRHVETHAQAALWVCCGVPMDDLRAREGVPREVLARPPIEFEPGLYLVGGCKKTFSRRDSLQRHLRNNEGRCFSDDRAPYQPGNRLAAR